MRSRAISWPRVLAVLALALAVLGPLAFLVYQSLLDAPFFTVWFLAATA